MRRGRYTPASTGLLLFDAHLVDGKELDCTLRSVELIDEVFPGEGAEVFWVEVHFGIQNVVFLTIVIGLDVHTFVVLDAPLFGVQNDGNLVPTSRGADNGAFGQDSVELLSAGKQRVQLGVP